MTRKIDAWKKPRSRGEHFTAAELDKIRIAFNSGVKPAFIARELKCASRTINIWYALFRAAGNSADVGPRHSQRPIRPSSDNVFIAPVEKKPVPPPNALPSVVAKLRGGRA